MHSGLGYKSSTRVGLLFLASAVAVHIAAIGYQAWADSPVHDEVGHLYAGLRHVQTGAADLYIVNPPFVRAWATLPLAVAGYRVESAAIRNVPLSRPEFALGPRFLESRDAEDVQRIFAIARWTCLPFSLLGAAVCYVWASELYGVNSGCAASTLWCISPTIIGHGHLMTPDVAAAAVNVCTWYLLWKWWTRRTFTLGVYSGIALGCALVTKFTCITTLAVLAIAWLWWAFRHAKEGSWVYVTRSLTECCGILLVCTFVVNMSYGFDGTFTLLGDYEFFSSVLSGRSDMQGGNRFRESIIGMIPLPVPRSFVLGIDLQRCDFERGLWSYIHGEWRRGGWWHYYIYALCIKEPVWTLALAPIALYRRMKVGASSSNGAGELVVFAGAVAFLGVVSSQTGFSHHFRYALPAIPFTFILLGGAFARDASVRGVSVYSVLGAICVCGAALSSVMSFPHSLSYYNCLIGGAENGYRHLLDSNTDWGQNAYYIRQWRQEHAELWPVFVAYGRQDILDVSLLGVHERQLPSPNVSLSGFSVPAGEESLQPGWYVMDPNILRAPGGRYALLERYPVRHIIARTVRVYFVDR